MDQKNEPRVLIWVDEQNGCDVYVDYTETVRPLIQWEIAKALAKLGLVPESPLPPELEIDP